MPVVPASLPDAKGILKPAPYVDAETGKRKSILETVDYLPRMVTMGKWLLLGGLTVMGVGLPWLMHHRSAWLIPHRVYKRPATHLGHVKGDVETYKAVTAGHGS